MEIFKRKWSELSGGRFDAEYYKESTFDILNKLKKKNFKKLEGIVTQSNYGILPPSNCYSDTNPIIFIRATELKEDLEIDFENALRVPKEFFVSRAMLKKNDILIAVKGATIASKKSVAFVKDDIDNAIFNGSIFRIRVNPAQFIPKCFAYILDSNILKEQCKVNLIANNAVDYLDKNVLNNLLFPNLSLETQQHIIDIMDNAYSLKKQKEQEAKELLDSIDKYLLDELGITLPNPQTHLQNRIWTTKFSELSGARFDPSYHQNYYKQLELALENGKYGVEKIKNLFDCVLNFSSLNCDNPCYIEIGDIDVSNANISYKNILKDKLPKNTKITIENGDLLISMVRPTRGAIAVYEGEKQAYCSGAFCVLREREYNKNVLQYILRSIIFRNLFEKYATGSTYPTIKNEDILNLKIPLPPLAIQEKIAEEIQKRKQKALKLTEEAKGLLEQAKKQVESMILGE